jgi:hypothetical protein
MPPPNDANMDALPLELKQRICSFLTPKNLKPLRLTSKIFATAAERYFLNRFFLFNYPDSIAALGEIVDHEVFGRYLTTLVCDTSIIRVYPSYEDCRPDPPLPSWDDYRPRTLVLGDTESYDSMTNKVMQRAQEEYQVACEDWEARKRSRQARRDWFRAMVYKRLGEAHHLRLTSTLEKALGKCPQLRNLVFSSEHTSIVEQRRFDMLGMLAYSHKDMPCWFGYLTKIWKSLSQLSSLTLISTGLEGLEDRSDFTLPNLKHLRINCSPKFPSAAEVTKCTHILRGATSLETLSLSLVEHDITDIIKSLRSDCLRVCLLRFNRVVGDALSNFILHHSASLQRLGLSHGTADNGWPSVFSSISSRLPALQRVQFETLQENSSSFSHMPLQNAPEAERFVAFGGPIPVLRYGKGYPGKKYRSKSDGGIYTDGSIQNQPLPGLWQDYEEIAIEGWNGFDYASEEDESEDEVR